MDGLQIDIWVTEKEEFLAPESLVQLSLCYELNTVPPPNSYIEVLQNVTLFENMVFIEVIKLK